MPVTSHKMHEFSDESLNSMPGGFANSAGGTPLLRNARGLGHTFADARVGPLLCVLVIPVIIVAVVLTQGTPFYLLRELRVCLYHSMFFFNVSYDF